MIRVTCLIFFCHCVIYVLHLLGLNCSVLIHKICTVPLSSVSAREGLSALLNVILGEGEIGKRRRETKE